MESNFQLFFWCKIAELTEILLLCAKKLRAVLDPYVYLGMTSIVEAEIRGYLLNAPSLSDESRLLRGWEGQLENEELVQSVKLLQRYNKQREKCLQNIRKMLEQQESRSNEPIQKACNVESTITGSNLSVELEGLIKIFKREPCLDQIGKTLF